VDESFCLETECENHPHTQKIMKKYIEIIDAKDLGNLCVLLIFNDGVQQIIDIGEFIRNHPHPQYDRYLNPKMFAKFRIENRNIVWGKNWDLIFPLDELHEGRIQ